MYTATGTDLDMTKLNIPYLKNHKDTRQLLISSIEFKIKELKETIFEDEVTDIQALLALVVVLKCHAGTVMATLYLGGLACSHHPMVFAGRR